MVSVPVADLLERAITARDSLIDLRHETAFRLFNGFTEGEPNLAVDLYARTVVIHNYADPPADGAPMVEVALELLRSRLPWVQTIVLKIRKSVAAEDKQGRLLYGSHPDQRVREHGVWYALDVTLNRDATLYLDTRNLRHWAINRLAGKSVLNTFAYTGSLGVAARAGGASRVVHLDLNRTFLNVAKTSYTLNGFPINKKDFQVGDFWPHVNQLKRAEGRFDCVFVDPPFFATTQKGVVDLAHNHTRVINKVRPLINDGGYLVAINNALFVSGAEYIAALEALCADGYLAIEELIPIPPDFTGFETTRKGTPITDPTPFNHSTKIAVLRVRRKAVAGRAVTMPGEL